MRERERERERERDRERERHRGVRTRSQYDSQYGIYCIADVKKIKKVENK